MEIFLPELVTAPLRAGASAVLSNALINEQLLFASHYATLADLIDWPAEIQERIQRVRIRYESHQALLKLLESLRTQVPMPLSADLAIKLAEGMEIHLEQHKNPAFYRDTCRKEWERYKPLESNVNRDEEEDPSSRLHRLANLLGLTPVERRLLIHALLFSIIPAWEVFTRLMHQHRRWRSAFWTTMLDVSETELASALSKNSKLASSGILATDNGLPTLSNFWTDLIIKRESSFLQALIQPMTHKASPDGVSRLPEEDWEILGAILKQKTTGISVLIYGKSGVDKRDLARKLVDSVDGAAFSLSGDIPEKDQPAAIMLANAVLAEKFYPAVTGRRKAHKPRFKIAADSLSFARPVLVIDRAPSVLTRTASGLLALFGLNDDEGDDGAKPIDEQLLTENPIPTIWLAQDASRLHRDTLAHFLFHAEALRGTRADRMAAVENLISSMPVTKAHKVELARLEGISGQQLRSARRLAELSGDKSRSDFGRRVVVAAMRSQKAMQRRTKDEARIPVTQYSLDFINATGRFGAPQILKALTLRPQASVCLYGLSGTGKTQFAEHIATQLMRPILIKHASQLFDKYLGESEKRIAEAFDEAEEEGAILLLDEADSFLRDRRRSQHQWEVSTVNEVLQRMERFEGIFICTTNLYTQLDIAALRRFTFKLEFLPLTLGQRWAMFLNETGLGGKTLSEQIQSTYEERLLLMRDLTPGDFATVKRQCILLGEQLTPEEWIEQLDLEVTAKARSASDERFRVTE